MQHLAHVLQVPGRAGPGIVARVDDAQGVQLPQPGQLRARGGKAFSGPCAGQVSAVAALHVFAAWFCSPQAKSSSSGSDLTSSTPAVVSLLQPSSSRRRRPPQCCASAASEASVSRKQARRSRCCRGSPAQHGSSGCCQVISPRALPPFRTNLDPQVHCQHQAGRASWSHSHAAPTCRCQLAHPCVGQPVAASHCQVLQLAQHRQPRQAHVRDQRLAAAQLEVAQGGEAPAAAGAAAL